MPINILGGWTAAGLTPGLQPNAPRDPGLATRQVTPVPTPTTAPGIASLSNPLIQNMLTAIYGPNYQNLLGTGAYQPPQQADPTKDPAYMEAKAYSDNLAAKNSAMHAYDSYQGQLRAAQQKVNQFSRPPGDFGGYNPAYNQAQLALTDLQTGGQGDAAMKISQAAALSPSYAPTIFQSAKPAAAAQQWNPYGMSGWISPVQSGLGNGPAQTPSFASSLLAMGA